MRETVRSSELATQTAPAPTAMPVGPRPTWMLRTVGARPGPGNRTRDSRLAAIRDPQRIRTRRDRRRPYAHGQRHQRLAADGIDFRDGVVVARGDQTPSGATAIPVCVPRTRRAATAMRFDVGSSVP